MSLKEALQQAYDKKPANLSGYLTLTDSIVHLMRHSFTNGEGTDLKKVYTAAKECMAPL